MAQKRRSNGTGSLVKLKSGGWAGQYSYKGKRKSVYGKTKQDAAIKLKEVLSQIELDLDIDAQAQPLSEWLNYWLATYAKPNIKQSTYISYEGYIRNHINPKIGDIALNRLSASVLQEFLVGLSVRCGGTFADKTVVNLKNMLHCALEQAVLNDIIAKNNINAVRLPKQRTAEQRVLSLEEQAALIEAARNYPNEAGFGIILDLFTGMRKGELLALQWCDLCEEKKSLKVNKTLNRLMVIDKKPNSDKKTEIVIGSTKTSSSARDIPLFDELYEDLLQHKERQIAQKTAAGRTHHETDYIITSTDFSYLDPRNYEALFRRVCERAGLSGVHIHTIRHTFATRALESGVDVYALSKLLGHAQPSTTLNKYGHALPNHKQECMEKIAFLYPRNE